VRSPGLLLCVAHLLGKSDYHSHNEPSCHLPNL
jgi:hypothetical protein